MKPKDTDRKHSKVVSQIREVSGRDNALSKGTIIKRGEKKKGHEKKGRDAINVKHGARAGGHGVSRAQGSKPFSDPGRELILTMNTEKKRKGSGNCKKKKGRKKGSRNKKERKPGRREGEKISKLNKGSQREIRGETSSQKKSPSDNQKWRRE